MSVVAGRNHRGTGRYRLVLWTLSPLVSNVRLTSDSGSMIPRVRTDSKKLSPST